MNTFKMCCCKWLSNTFIDFTLCSSKALQSHTCSCETARGEKKPNTYVSQSADDLACCTALARKQHKDFLLLIMGFGRRAEWNSERGQLDKERPANYTAGKIYMFRGSRSKINALSHPARCRYNGATVIHRRLEFSVWWPIVLSASSSTVIQNTQKGKRRILNRVKQTEKTLYTVSRFGWL